MNEKELRAEASRLMDVGDYEGAGKLLGSLKRKKSIKKSNALKGKYIDAVSKALNKLMAENDVNASEIARSTGLAPSTVRSVASGLSRDPSYRIVVVLADYFGVSTDYFKGK